MNRRTILVVDDEPVILLTLGAVFENAGYSVLRADCPETALQQFRSHFVDVVVMEHEVFENGTWLGSELKRIKPHVPIMVFSADPDAHVARAYADALAAKPEHPRILLQMIRSLVQQRRRRPRLSLAA